MSAVNRWFALHLTGALSTFLLTGAGATLPFSEKAHDLANYFGYNFEPSIKNFAIALTPAFAAFIATGVKLWKTPNPPKNLKEFYKLNDKVRDADSFIPTYRNYLLEGKILKQSF